MLAIAATNANDEAGGGKPYREGTNLRHHYLNICPTMCYAPMPLNEMAQKNECIHWFFNRNKIWRFL